MEKQEYTLIKAWKEFIVYILHSHVVAYVLSAAVKEILTRSDPDGRRAKWIAIFVRIWFGDKTNEDNQGGKGLEKLMTQSNYDALEINMMEIDFAPVIVSNKLDICPDFLASMWYKDIIYVL